MANLFPVCITFVCNFIFLFLSFFFFLSLTFLHLPRSLVSPPSWCPSLNFPPQHLQDIQASRDHGSPAWNTLSSYRTSRQASTQTSEMQVTIMLFPFRAICFIYFFFFLFVLLMLVKRYILFISFNIADFKLFVTSQLVMVFAFAFILTSSTLCSDDYFSRNDCSAPRVHQRLSATSFILSKSRSQSIADQMLPPPL